MNFSDHAEEPARLQHDHGDCIDGVGDVAATWQPLAEVAGSGRVGQSETARVSKNDEICIKNEEFCIKNDEFCRSPRWQGSPRPVVQYADDSSGQSSTDLEEMFLEGADEAIRR